jgi:choline dehydrogenase-like flavoprotein
MKIYAMEFGRTKTRGELALRPEVQRDYRILNGTTSLAPGTPGEEVKSTFQLLTPQTLEALMAWEKAGRKGPPPIKRPERSSADSSPSMPPRAFHMATRQEQAPNPDSRITLSSERDALGMPRVKLDWRLTELDKRSIRIFYEVLGRVFGQSGTGRVQIRDWLLGDDRTWPSFISGGWHHMGTTRMHVDPRQGVVNADCRVHGLSNLYISGAAVYPTAGSANPTLTLVALSLRLSDYLKKTLA